MIDFSFNSPLTQPLDAEAPLVMPPSQTADGDEYICGETGNAHPYANPGRDQDRSRADECQPAIACGRYISGA